MAEIKKKVSIYLASQNLQNLHQKHTTKNTGQYVKFSRRIADIVDRYDILMGLTEVPELSDNEKVILGEAVLGGFIDKMKIRYLSESIRDTELEGCDELANKVEEMNYVQRVALIETLDI